MNDPEDPKLPDLRYIRELAKMFRQYELDELEIESGDHRILLRQADYASAPAVAMAAPPVAMPAAAPSRPQAVASEAVATGDFITSPFVGTFYRSARPDAPSFVEVGKRVQAGETVCIIEAMKLFNEIEADFSCSIEEILVENGQPVEYG
ncbi:MAG TPA: acetyl-CoA carboxylase biotin carboxyl carrier protein, partial [Nannocystaceae bacterium]|nr:acetyl-CoA carboxylase biotin carboxyl carrier protein [Nannocystaceae bacterium]